MVSHLEDALLFQIKCLKIDLPQTEYRFALHHVGGPGKNIRRKLIDAGLKDWRFDFAWPDLKFAVEVEGITPAGGRHQRIKGFNDDLDKYHAAIEMGWTVYRISGRLIASGKAVQLIKKMVSDQKYQRVLAYPRSAGKRVKDASLKAEKAMKPCEHGNHPFGYCQECCREMADKIRRSCKGVIID